MAIDTRNAPSWVCLLLLSSFLPAQDEKASGEKPPAGEIPIPSDTQGPTTELTLRDALILGRRNNTNLKVGELLPLQAEQDLRLAHASFDPELYSNLSVSKSKDPTRNIFQPEITRELFTATMGVRQLTSTGGTFDLSYSPTRLNQSTTVLGFPESQYTSALRGSFRQPLLRGAWTDYGLKGVRVAQTALAASQLRFDRSVQETLLNIVQAYWELVFARENFRVMFAARALAGEQLAFTNEQIRVGAKAERDRIADEAEVARREEELIATENEIRSRDDTLRRLLFDDQQGEVWQASAVPVSPFEVEVDTKVLDWRQLARDSLDQRPDIKALRADVSIAEEDLLVAERDVLPQLDLVGAYTTDGTRDSFHMAWDDTVGFDLPDWSLTIELSLPIGNKGPRARRDRARLELERKRRLLYASEMDVAKEVREAVRRLRTLALSILASKESVRLAESDLDTEQQKVRVGLSTAFEVQRRNQALLDARTRHLRNQLDYHIARANHLYSQGLLGVPESDGAGAKAVPEKK